MDLQSALKMAFKSNKPTLSEQIRDTLGIYRFLYYKYTDYFKKNPFDLDDLIDGLIYIHLTSQRDES